jgi:hypothetical protein
LDGTLVTKIKGPACCVTSATFSPDGDHVLARYSDNMAILWPTSIKSHYTISLIALILKLSQADRKDLVLKNEYFNNIFNQLPLDVRH